MLIEYGKTLTEYEKISVKRIANACDILEDTARLLFYRKIDTEEKARKFLRPSKNNFNNPFLLNDMENAVSRIITAKNNGEKVLVFGDYDADGVCASAILYDALTNEGIKTFVAVPEREEGYGLNYNKVLNYVETEGVSLVVSVDCGISDCETVEKIKLLGVDVIVTDHHEPPVILPNCIKINPKIKGQAYPFTELCGAGVAYKLAYAIMGDKANKYLDFVALATVSDSMDLVGENRDLVTEGLKICNSSKIRHAFKYLIGDTNKKILAQTLAFQVAPRVNAGGRMGDANCALKLFTSKDENELFNLSIELNKYNIARQAECDIIYKESKKRIEENNLKDREVITVYDEKWKMGFVGIVAARLVEEYNKPVIVFAGNNGTLKGSARSAEDINVYEAITSASDILINFGGHSQAAGVSLKVEDFDLFTDKICEYVKGLNLPQIRDKKIYVDWEINDQISMRFAREIDLLEPFGVGNKKPVFSVTANGIKSMPLKENSPHYNFNVNELEMLDFNGANDCFSLSLPIDKKIIFELNYSVFKDKESVKCFVKDIDVNYGEYSKIKLFILMQELKKLTDENIKISYGDRYKNDINSAIKSLSLDREVFAKEYNDLIKLCGTKFYNSSVYYSENGGNEQSVFCAEVFIELGFFEIKNGTLKACKGVKSPLTDSKIYNFVKSIVG